MSNSLRFFKTEAGGNDFVTFIDLESKLPNKELPLLAKRVCPRATAIGADGIIIIRKSKTADLKMLYFNSDGSYAALCGNGLRTVGLLGFREKFTDKKLTVETDAGIFNLEVCAKNIVRNSFDPPQIVKSNLKLKNNRMIYTGTLVNVGIPYFCTILDFSKQLDDVDVQKDGSFIRNHPDSGPAGTNVTFISVENRNKIKIRIFERGIEGETLSSGTGSYSSAVVAALGGFVKSPVTVESPGGSVNVVFKVENEDICQPFLEGKATILFSGTFIDL